MAKTDAVLTQLDPKVIHPNPDNPRLIFREKQMNELLDSISEVGIKVPLSVYRKDDVYFLIDGERRWRCASRLNIQEVPAIVQPEPTPLENLLMMFNIHNVRVDWDLMPMAIKLKSIRDLLEKNNQKVNPKDLAGITGISLSTVKRAFEILDLPEKYKKMLMLEAEKPKDKQLVTADLFFEIKKSGKVIRNYIPEVFEHTKYENYFDHMVDKYLNKVITNVVNFRLVSKIARTELAGGIKENAIPVLIKLIEEPLYTIEDAYSETVEMAYLQRDLSSKAQSFSESLSNLKGEKYLTSELRKSLENLRLEINRIIG